MTGADDGLAWLTGRGVVLLAVVATLVLTGPLGVVDVTQAPATIGEGRATVEVVSEPPDQLTVTDGRFGTGVTYLRLPDAVVDVRELSGSPRLVYEITVANMSVERTVRHVLTEEGKLRLRLPDRALSPDVSAGTYTGHVALRLQSVSNQTVLVDTDVEVTVP